MAALHGQQNMIYIPRSIEQEMARHMFSSLPQEACGVVLGEAAAGGMRISRFKPIRNVAPDPLHHFVMDEVEWIRCVFQEKQLIGIFHSHPRTSPIPSARDLDNLPSFAGLLRIYLIGSPVPASSSNARMLLGGYEIMKAPEKGSLSSSTESYALQPTPLSVT